MKIGSLIEAETGTSGEWQQVIDYLPMKIGSLIEARQRARACSRWRRLSADEDRQPH